MNSSKAGLKFLKRIFVCIVFALAIFCFFSIFCGFKSMETEKIRFSFENRIFTYSLNQNKLSAPTFLDEFEINKYSRFGSKAERVKLLKKMLEIGIDEEVALNYLFPNLSVTVARIEKNIFVAPKDASVKVTNSEKAFEIQREIIGRRLDKTLLYRDLAFSYLSGADLMISVKANKLYPEIYSKDIEKYSHLRASFSTSIASSSPDRKHNVKNALSALNKVEIYPNEVFSFNKVIGKRTKENGYREAKIIINNEFVDGLGGGVCQVSTTLYNTALLAGLKIVEANKHSKQVGYVKYGFDAMVNFGSSDLKFKNNTSEKLTIITNYSPDTIRIRIYGASLNGKTYKLTNEILSVTEPITETAVDTLLNYTDKVTYEDEYFLLKKPARGMEIKTYREIYLNGELTEREFLRQDTYKVQNGLKVYGTKKREDYSLSLSGRI